MCIFHMEGLRRFAIGLAGVQIKDRTPIWNVACVECSYASNHTYNRDVTSCKVKVIVMDFSPLIMGAEVY